MKQGCNLSPTLFKLFIEDLKLEFSPECDPVRVGNYAVNHLLYADDLILLSQSAEGLQLTLDKLHSYCLRWNLQINVKKSKAMVFNKTGKIPKNVSFNVGDSALPLVNRFKYLGTILSSSGSQIPAAKSLCDKTSKAYFALRTVLQKFNYEPPLSLKIFDTALKPILMYNCEIWAQLSSRQIRLLDGKDDIFSFLMNSHLDYTEKVHTRFCKSVLGANASCSNFAIWGELGRLPIKLSIFKHLLVYYHRLLVSEEDNLLTNAFKESDYLKSEGGFGWLSTIEVLLKSLGIQTDKAKITRMKAGAFKRFITKLISNEFEQYWRNTILSQDGSSNKGGNKLRSYSLYKTPFHVEPYLQMQDRSARRTLAKFRCSDHSLEIEVGRHKGIPEKDRICRRCSLNCIENEEHFLLTCNAYDEPRNKLLLLFRQLVPNFRNLVLRQKFMFMMSNENLGLIKEIATFLEIAFKLREQTLSC